MFRIPSLLAIVTVLSLVGCGDDAPTTSTSTPSTSTTSIAPTRVDGPSSTTVIVHNGVVRYRGLVIRLPARWRVVAVGNGHALDVTAATGGHRAGIRLEPGRASVRALRARAAAADDLNARTDTDRVLTRRDWAGGPAYELRSRFDAASLRSRHGAGRGWLLTVTSVGPIRGDDAFAARVDHALRTLRLPAREKR